MRDGLFDYEVVQAVEALRAGQEWAAVRVMHAGLDPVAMDRNKAVLLKRAGVTEEKVPAKPAGKTKADPLE